MIATVAAALPAQVAPGLRFAELGRRYLPYGQDDTTALATGDVDGDGDLDLVVGNGAGHGFGQQNRLYLDDGNGVFTDVTAARMPAIVDDTTSVVLGDVDGDGDLDLLVGNYGYGGQNRLYLNDGTGSFIDVTATRLPPLRDSTTSLALGDVDGDGDLDLVVGNAQVGRPAGQNRLYLNNGRGSFTDATNKLPGLGLDTRSIALGDVDGDGDLDLVVGNYRQLNQLYVNDGHGSFTEVTAARLPPAKDPTYSLALGDVDGDGDLDLLVGNGGQNLLYLNNGSGSFSDVTAARMPVFADATRSVALGDVDGDGDLDLLVGDGSRLEQNRLYLNNGTGSFSDVTASQMPVFLDDTRSLALGDVDGDGDCDLLVGNISFTLGRSQQNRLFLNDGRGSFAAIQGSRLPMYLEYSCSLALGDLDGDGDLDVVVGNDNGQQNRLFLGDGRGAFTDVTASQMPAIADSTRSVALGDVDGDGDLDLAVGNSGPNGEQNRLDLNDGRGTFTDVTASHMPALAFDTRAIALGDVDGDGDLDLVAGNSGYPAQQNRLYLNNGSGTFTDVTPSRLPMDSDPTTSVALGDVDGDGDLDLYVGNYYNAQNRLYVNNGTGSFSDVSTTHLPPLLYRTHSVAFGDVDGDGDLDLVVADSSSVPQNYLFVNDGSGIFSDATATHLPAPTEPTYGLTLGDIDGDGDLDILLANARQIGADLNDGQGSFTDVTATQLSTTSGATSVALGDIDADGDLDVVAVGGGGDDHLLTNLQRQLDAPYLLRPGRPYTLEVYSRYGPPSVSDVAMAYLSTVPASMPLPPLGILGIQPLLALPPVVIQRPAGVGRVSFAVPNLTGVTGVPVYAQALLLHWPLELRLTNTIADVIAR